MEYQSIVIDESEKEEEIANIRGKRSMKSLPNGASSSLAKEESVPRPSLERIEEDEASETWSSQGQGEYEVLEATESWQMQEEQKRDKAYIRSEAEFESSLRLIERRLEERRQVVRQGEGRSSSISIFRLPHSLIGINHKAQWPEIVSIGPYHRGKDHLLEFEEHKWSFLQNFLYRANASRRDLSQYLDMMMALEERTRECYSEIVLMSSHDFVEMMLLDGCFVIELLRHLGQNGDAIDEDDPIFTRPWLIPILIRDLLKLENQLPFFVLETLFIESKSDYDPKTNPLHELALNVFDLAFPRPVEIIHRCKYLRGKHLLDLFHLSLLPLNTNYIELEEYRPSDQSIQCVTQLRPSGIKFKSRKADSFLDINFRKRVLEIPSMTINDFTSTVLINCVALEQCQEHGSKCFTDYIAFMNCLIKQPRDVAFLCSDGIITRFSQDDQYVAKLFNNLGKYTVFNIRNCYISKQFRQVEAYYSNNWAIMMRTYFSNPWSFILVFSAFILLALTMVQSVMSVLSYNRQFG